MNAQNVIDSIDLDSVDGFDIRAEIVPDDTAYDEPQGDYPPEIVEAWRNDDWHYVTIIVTASRAGTDLGSDSLCMVEYGTFPHTDGTVWVDPLRDKDGSLAYYRADMIDNAVADARMKLTELIDQAIDGSME